MIMKRYVLILVSVVVSMGVMTVGNPEAEARVSLLKGKILITQKVPKKGDNLAKFYKKNATGNLTTKKGESKWQFYFFAVLRKSPPSDVVNIVFYEYRGGRYKYINAEDLKISNVGGGLIQVTGKYKLFSVLGFKKGKSYQMRLAVKNARGNEVVYARSRRLFLK
jgi:hypothetical protein